MQFLLKSTGKLVDKAIQDIETIGQIFVQIYKMILVMTINKIGFYHILKLISSSFSQVLDMTLLLRF